jgi:hypothetical protein
LVISTIGKMMNSGYEEITPRFLEVAPKGIGNADIEILHVNIIYQG